MHKRTKKQEYKCYVCRERIDVGACDNNYIILTNVNNRPSPITKDRKYICQDCTTLVNLRIEALKYEKASMESIL